MRYIHIVDTHTYNIYISENDYIQPLFINHTTQNTYYGSYATVQLKEYTLMPTLTACLHLSPSHCQLSTSPRSWKEFCLIIQPQNKWRIYAMAVVLNSPKQFNSRLQWTNVDFWLNTDTFFLNRFTFPVSLNLFKK